MAKEAVLKAFESPLSEGLAAERKSFYFLFSTEDQKEGMHAFLEKAKRRIQRTLNERWQPKSSST